MGLALIAKSGNGNGPRSRVLLPVQTGLKIVRYFGQTEAQSKRNLADINLIDGSFSGSFTINPDRAALARMAMFTDSSLVESASGTIIVAARTTETDLSLAANRPNFGGFQIPGGNGFSIYPGSNTVIRAGAQIGGAQVVANITTTLASLQAWNLWAATVDAGVGINFYNLTTGQTATLANTGARTLTGNPFTHGGSTGLQGAMDVAASVVHNVALTKVQIDKQAAVIRKFLSEVRGITV